MKKNLLFIALLFISPATFAQFSCSDVFEAPKTFVSQNVEVVYGPGGTGITSGAVINYGYDTVARNNNQRYLLSSYISMNFSIKEGTLTLLEVHGHLMRPHRFAGYFRPMLNALIAENPGIFNVVFKVQGADAKKFLIQKTEGLSDAEALAFHATYSQLAATGFTQVKSAEVFHQRIQEKNSQGKLPEAITQPFIYLTVSRPLSFQN